MPNEYIQFINNTDLPVLIDSWIDGFNFKKTFRVEAFEKKIIYSEVGEWHLHARFESERDITIWKQKGNKLLHRNITIGSFHSTPCASGNYSWLETDDFECVYSELQIPEKHVKGVVIFSFSQKNIIK